MSVYGARPKGLFTKPKSRARRRAEEPGSGDIPRAAKLVVCGTLDAGVQAHHALPKSWVKDAAWREGLRGEDYWAAVWDPGILVPLTTRRHERHTNRVAVIPLEALRPGLEDYVLARWGTAGVDALRREHPPAGR